MESTAADSANLQLSALTFDEVLEIRSALSAHIRRLEDYARFSNDPALAQALNHARSAHEKASRS